MIKITPFQQFKKHELYLFNYSATSGRMNLITDIIRALIDDNKTVFVFDFENLPFQNIFQEKNLLYCLDKMVLWSVPVKNDISNLILNSLENLYLVNGDDVIIFFPSLYKLSMNYNPKLHNIEADYNFKKDMVINLLEKMSQKFYTIILGDQLSREEDNL